MMGVETLLLMPLRRMGQRLPVWGLGGGAWTSSPWLELITIDSVGAQQQQPPDERESPNKDLGVPAFFVGDGWIGLGSCAVE